MIWGTGDNPDQTKPFVEHLEDLRKTLIRSACLLAGGMLIAIPLTPYILRLVKIPLARTGVEPEEFLRVIHVAGGLSITMRVVFWGGLLMSLPFVVLVVGNFVLPGLKAKEKKVIFHSSGFALALFIAGLSMGYFLTLPVAIRMIFRINNWLGVSCDFVELADYISFVLRILLAFGLAFELPVIVVVLGRIGIISLDQLRTGRRYVAVGILIVAMLLTPPDPITQMLMALPLIVLYEICIWVVWFGEKARRENT